MILWDKAEYKGWYKIWERWTKFSHIKSAMELSCTVAQKNWEFHHLLDCSECFFPSRKLLQHKYISAQNSLKKEKRLWYPTTSILVPSSKAHHTKKHCTKASTNSPLWHVVSVLGPHLLHELMQEGSQTQKAESTSEVSSTHPCLGVILSTPTGKFWHVCPSSKNLHRWRSQHFEGHPSTSWLLS